MIDMKKINYYSEGPSVYSNSYLDWKPVDSGYIEFGIACGFVSTTEVQFVNEEIIARITAAGNIEFFDMEENLLASISIPASDEGRGCYINVCCKVEGDTIFVRFPEYTWYDNYPNCDGSYDRWDARVIGYKAPVSFCVTTRTVSVVAE